MLEVLERMRESEQAACDVHDPNVALIWLARARAFDEAYTEMKGRGMDKDPW